MGSTWCTLFTLVGLIWCQISAQSPILTVAEHPSSLLVPVNETAQFSCTALCSNAPLPCSITGRWIINNTLLWSQHGSENFTMILTLPIWDKKLSYFNNSNVRCHFDVNTDQADEHTDSDLASLTVLPKSDLLHLHSYLLETNASNVMLTWSPLLLWPGHAIQCFNVSITNKTDGNVTYHKINSAFGDRVVSFTNELLDLSLMCTEITVNITAISTYSYSTLQQPLKTFSATGIILPSSSLRSSEITTNIHLLCDETTEPSAVNLMLVIQLPGYTCSHRLIEVNVTVIFKNGENDSVAEIGPIPRYGSSVIMQNFTSILEGNQTYSVTIQVLYGFNVIASHEHQFDWYGCEKNFTTVTNYDDNMDYVDYVLIGGSLILVLGTILALTTGMYIFYWTNRKKNRMKRLRANIQNSLMNNPLYDGTDGPMPLYEQIPLRNVIQTTISLIDETQRATRSDTHTYNNNHQCCSFTRENHYVDQPTCGLKNQPMDATAECKELVDPDSCFDTFPSETQAKSLHDTLPVDGKVDVDSCSVNENKEGTSPERGLTVMTEKHIADLEIVNVDGDKSYGMLTPAGLL